MKRKTKEEMFAYMDAWDHPNTPDGAWQAMLEEAAEEWGRANNIEVDGFDAFMEYLEWKQ